MRWTWRFYGLLAFMLAVSIAFMDMIGAAKEFDASTWWRLFIAVSLGQMAGYAPAFGAIATAARLSRTRRVWTLAGAVATGTAIGVPIHRAVVEAIAGPLAKRVLDWPQDIAAMASLFAVIAFAIELQLRQDEAAAALHAQS